MGIHNIHFLTDPDTPPTQTRKVAVSQHIVVQGEKKYMFGWDQPLMSFYLQIHDLTLDEDDENRVDFALGASADTIFYEVDTFVDAAKRYGLDIPHTTQVKLYGEKDDGS